MDNCVPDEDESTNKKASNQVEKVKSSVDLIVNSISEIIKCSSNDNFRASCFKAMKVDNRQDFEKSLWQHACKVVKTRHGINIESKDLKDEMYQEFSNNKENKALKEKEIIHVNDDKEDDDEDDSNGLEFF